MSRAFWAVVAATVAVGVVFAIWPGLDLAAAHYFYDGGGFIGASPLARAARDVFPRRAVRRPRRPLYLARSLRSARRRRRRPRAGAGDPPARRAPALGPDGRSVAFLIVTIAVGSGLIANLGLKEHAHRPRPVHVVEFGGHDEFRPWDRFDGACRKNCSFVSGEAASGFWMVAPACSRRRRGALRRSPAPSPSAPRRAS